MGLQEDRSCQVGRIFLLGLPLNTDTPTLEIVTCKLLLLKTYNLTIFSIQVCLRDIFS